MKDLSKRQLITYSVLLFLLLGRTFISVATIPMWVEQLNEARNWVNEIYESGGFLLIALVILLNQDNLQALNIDGFFIFMFLYSGLAVSIVHFLGLGCLAAVATILLSLYALSKNNFRFGDVDPITGRRIILSAIAIFMVGFLAVATLVDFSKMEQALYDFFVRAVPGVIYEEVIYRGMLWMFLKDLKLNGLRIVLFQAFLFLLAHISYLFTDPGGFWVFIPIVGLVLGYIVLRAKSITPSSIAHMLIDLFFGVILGSV